MLSQHAEKALPEDDERSRLAPYGSLDAILKAGARSRKNRDEVLRLVQRESGQKPPSPPLSGGLSHLKRIRESLKRAPAMDEPSG